MFCVKYKELGFNKVKYLIDLVVEYSLYLVTAPCSVVSATYYVEEMRTGSVAFCYQLYALLGNFVPVLDQAQAREPPACSSL